MNIKHRKLLSTVLIFALAFGMFAGMPIKANAAGPTFSNLVDSVQHKLDTAEEYKAYAEVALAEGYPVIAGLFLATAEAEAKQAEDAWEILLSMGATVKPDPSMPTVGNTLQNLDTAFNGELVAYTSTYLNYYNDLNIDPMEEAKVFFYKTMGADETHKINFGHVSDYLVSNDYDSIESEYGKLYRCVNCGEVVTALPANCQVCSKAGSSFVEYTRNYSNLYAMLYHKQNAAVSFFDRMKMAETFKKCGDNIVISGIENTGKKRKSYTFSTVKKLKKKYPDAGVFMLIGSDMAESFETWHLYRRLCACVTIVTANRSSGNNTALKTAIEKIKRIGGKVVALDLEPIEISSTELRQKLKSGESTKGLLSEYVAEYATKRNLYR